MIVSSMTERTKFFTKKALQSLLGLRRYLLFFQKYLLFTASSSLIGQVPYYRNKFNDLKFLLGFLNNGDTCIDIGANIGVYTLKMAEAVGNLGHVYSFEPVTLNYQIMLRSIPPKFKNVITCEHLAVSDHIGEVTIVMPELDGVYLHGLCHVTADPLNPNDKAEVVNSTTLDEYFKHIIGPIKLIKCDVEGHESKIFSGGKSLLAKHKPIIICELQQNENLVCTFELLEGLGYKGFYIERSELKLVSKTEEGWKDKVNYFFLPNSTPPVLPL